MTMTQAEQKIAKKKEALQQMINDLRSGDEEKVYRALISAKKKGNVTVLPAVVDALIAGHGDRVDKAAHAILSQLKSSKSVDPLIEALNDPRTRGKRKMLVSAFWEAGLDASPYVVLLTGLAIREDFLTAFECLTVIENLPKLPSEDEARDAMDLIEDALQQEPDEKEDLLRNIYELLEDYSLGG